jgi:ATP-dependent DNA ligase
MALEQCIILVTAIAVAIVPVILIAANRRSKVRVDDDDREVSLVAFDLLEKDGEDLRPLTLVERKRRLAHLLQSVKAGIELNEHLEGDGADIFRAAGSLGHEGIVAKRRDSRYESGRSMRWVKIKNPDSAAAKRLEDGSF